MNDYEQKQEARRERLERAADRARGESAGAFQRARDAVAGIEFGQPILVGHHSEKRHRAALRRQDAAMRRGIEQEKEAAELERRAAAVGTGGISSDDPDAAAKLREKLAALEAERERKKALNAAQRRGTFDAIATDEERAAFARLRAIAPYETQPAPRYHLTNLGARIRETTRRIAELEQRATRADREPITHNLEGGATLVEDFADNRVVLRFPARLPRAGYQAVRRWGFVWSPTRNGFVRQHAGAHVVELARHAAAAALAAK